MRPKHSDVRCLTIAAESVADEFCRWADDEMDRTDAVAALVEAMQYGESDGYRLAVNLDRQGYSPDAELVDILSGISLYSAHTTLVKEWVRENPMKPPFPVGTEVEFTSSGKLNRGFISRIEAETAQYIVRVPAEGHVVDGLGCHGTYVDYERVSRPAAPAAKE